MKRKVKMTNAQVVSIGMFSKQRVSVDKAIEMIADGYILNLEGDVNDPERNFNGGIKTSTILKITEDGGVYNVETRNTIYVIASDQLF